MRFVRAIGWAVLVLAGIYGLAWLCAAAFSIVAPDAR